jgi:hypothetical protein
MYRYISRESCSQFDSLPLTSLTSQTQRCACADLRRAGSGVRRCCGATCRVGATTTGHTRGRAIAAPRPKRPRPVDSRPPIAPGGAQRERETRGAVPPFDRGAPAAARSAPLEPRRAASDAEAAAAAAAAVCAGGAQLGGGCGSAGTVTVVHRADSRELYMRHCCSTTSIEGMLP